MCCFYVVCCFLFVEFVLLLLVWRFLMSGVVGVWLLFVEDE